MVQVEREKVALLVLSMHFVHVSAFSSFNMIRKKNPVRLTRATHIVCEIYCITKTIYETIDP